MENTNLAMFEGTDTNFDLTFTDAAGNPIDITDYKIFFTVKKNINDDDDDAIISKTITDHTTPTEGKTTITIDRADTIDIKNRTYLYDVQWIDATDKRKIIMLGTFSITEVVTDRNE